MHGGLSTPTCRYLIPDQRPMLEEVKYRGEEKLDLDEAKTLNHIACDDQALFRRTSMAWHQRVVHLKRRCR